MLIDLIKLGLSLLLSFFIGIEREKQDKPAGLRDIMLISFGTTIFTIIGIKFMNYSTIDSFRLLYACILGIGFLGSGVIIKRRKEIEGITTASTLWAIVGIGLLCGIGEYILAIVSALVIYFILKLKYLKRRYFYEGNYKGCFKK